MQAAEPGLDQARPTDPRTALTGNRAVLVLLIVQNVVGGGLPALHVPLGWALVASFVASALVFGVFFRAPLGALFASRRWRTPPAPWVALGGLLLALVASRGVTLFVASVWPQSFQGVASFTGTGLGLWLLLVGAGLLIPLAEEVAFRGLLLPGYERVRPAVQAGFLAALVFAGAHGLPGQALAILPLAWVLVRAVQHSGSFWTGYLIHAGNNLLAVWLGSALSQNKTLDTLANGLGTVPLGFGLGGLLVGAAALWLATSWLRPRDLPATPPGTGPVWSGSLIVIVVLVVLLALSALLAALFPQFFPGLPGGV